MNTTSKASRRISGVFLRGNRYWFRFTHNGEQLRMPLGTDDEIQAIANAQDILRNPELMPVDILRREFSTYVADRMNRKKFTSRTGPETERVLKDFATFSNVRDAQRITSETILQWYRSLKESEADESGKLIRAGINEDSAQTYVARLAGFLRWLHDQRKIRHNPMDDVELDELIRIPRRDFCTFETRDRLIDSCQRTDIKFCLYAGFHAGMRKGEIIEARVNWFDFTQDVIHIPITEYWHPKGKKGRDVPLTREFKAFILSKMRSVRRVLKKDSYMLHPGVKKGKYRYRWDFRRPFDEHMESQGCPEVYPHMMRKTFGSLLATRGVSLFKIASWLGDDIRTTQKNYAWLLPKDDEIEKAFQKTVPAGTP